MYCTLLGLYLSEMKVSLTILKNTIEKYNSILPIEHQVRFHVYLFINFSKCVPSVNESSVESWWYKNP